MLYDRLGNPLGELAEADVFEAVLREEINGEHSLTITTTRVLEKGIRMLYEDGRSKWREFVVAGVDAEHASGNRAIGTYYCVWSVQQDLQGVTVSVMPGVQSPTTAALALTSLLSTTSRWSRGTVTQTSTGGASMYDRSAWEALSTLVEVWGGEVDATIEIGTQSGVVGRAVDLYAAQGEQTAMRRFDFGADLMSVKRTLADNPLFCRISPRGKGEQTDAGGYGRKITIESVNGGLDYLTYQPMVDAAKLPDGNGGYEYPTLIVENSDCETPADLKTWAQSVLAEYCTPKVTYEVDVLQAGIEGVDVSGVSLGDAVQVVDRKFGGDGIRVQGRVRSITTDLLNERDIKIVIGDAEESISSKFAKVDKSLASVNNDLTVMSTADYIDNLLDRINTEINATGGYTYIVPGNGILTFDVAVADPLNPVEASQVVEVKGGSIRIANSRTAQGAWEWKTVFTSGHIAANLVTAANITTGYIGSSGDTFIDLDSHTVQLGQTSSNHVVVDSNGMNAYKGSSSLLFAGTSGGASMVRVGNNSSGAGNMIITDSSMSMRYGSNEVIHFGISGSNLYTSIGTRKSGATIGDHSLSQGSNCTASAIYSFSRGDRCVASGRVSLASGSDCTASADNAIAIGVGCTASDTYSVALGDRAQSSYSGQVAIGSFNISSSQRDFIIGGGNPYGRANNLYVTSSGDLWIKGTLTQNSDRRLKEHIAYLDDDACEFVRRLKPALFVKDGDRHLGFYAQDVDEADTWDTVMVEPQHTDESKDFDPLTLEYTALIAPLVAYCQHLEKRIGELEERIEALEEGRC